MPIVIRRFTGGALETNAYLLVDSSSGDAVVIDAPLGVTAEVMSTAESLGATVNQIVVTHGHWDHIEDLKEMSEELDARIGGHPDVRARLETPTVVETPQPIPAVTMHDELNEGDQVVVGGHVFNVMYMPGHDVAHIILYSEDDGLIFGGDVLFPGGHGRTDVPGADQATMNRTLRRFLDLPGEVRVFPGHGDETTLAAEQGWIRQISED